ncbi:hypothetical protein SRABI112_05360 [Pseudomonas mediterranea]|nr:hypothetical protein SRABI112_05360 [Pseudomonas mediterranea]
MGQEDAQWRKHRPQQRNQQRRAIAHQAMAQAIDGAHRRRTAHGEQRHGRGLGHAQPQPQHQCRNRENAAARPGQSQDQAHGHTEKTRQ